MVVFTCNNCGESLQKPKVAKHYQFQCRSAENLTCVDCHKDFYGQEYVAHTKCVTESERYGGQDYVARPGQNKGERKQQEWLNVVKNVFDTATNLNQDERNLLNTLSKYDNIPRKKAKFLNFINNVMGRRVNMSVIDSVWTKMETAFKGPAPAANNNAQAQNTNDKENGSCAANGSSPSKNHESNVAENQNNENIIRENVATEQNGVEPAANTEGKKKKSKKRDLAEPKTEESEEPVSKKKKKTEAEITEDATPVEKEESQETAKFDWKAAILEIVGSKDEIAVKKLRKKVVNRYLNHCGNSVTLEKATSRFDKKLRKTSEVVINDDKVRLS